MTLYIFLKISNFYLILKNNDDKLPENIIKAKKKLILIGKVII